MLFSTHSIFSTIIILLVYCFINEGCKVLVGVQSQTNTPFKFQIMIPSINAETEQVFFGVRSQKNVLVDGENCMSKHWKLITQKQDAAGNWVVAHEAVVKLDGMGEIMVHVGEELLPRIGKRLGVACSESIVCG